MWARGLHEERGLPRAGVVIAPAVLMIPSPHLFWYRWSRPLPDIY